MLIILIEYIYYNIFVLLYYYDIIIMDIIVNIKKKKKQVIRVEKLVGLPPPHSNYLDVFFRFKRAFAKVITFVGASAHEF